MISDPAALAADAHLQSVSVADRRRSGMVYTPEHLANFILDQAGYLPSADVQRRPFLDPACGAGVFLCEALRRLARSFADPEGAGVLKGSRRAAFLAGATRNIFGYDIDPRGRALTLDALRAECHALAPGPLPDLFLEQNIRLADFLAEPDRTLRAGVHGEAFGYIVGNPPYVSTQRLDASYKDTLRRNFTTAAGRLDLYTLFFERALDLLDADGTLAFISPDKYLSSETSRKLRAYITRHGHVRTVARFRSHKLFPGAAVVPCITVIDKRRVIKDVRLLTCHAGSNQTVKVVSQATAPFDQLGEEPWHFRSPALLGIVRRLQAGHTPLVDIAKRISAGPASGLDDVFVRPASELGGLETRYIYPAIRGRDISAFKLSDPNLGIVVPYDFTPQGPRPAPLAQAPRLRRYLEAHRERLEKRHCVRVWEKAWFELHDPPTLDVSLVPKILVPDVAETCRFAVDEGRYFPLHSAYYIVLHEPESLSFVTTVLNSKWIEFVVRLLAPVAKDGFSRFRKQFLVTLPIPAVDRRIQRELIRLGEDGTQQDELDDRFAAIFGLSRTDRRSIDRFLAGLQNGSAA